MIIPDPLPFPIELLKWLSDLPYKDRMREYEIAEANIRRILIHKGYTDDRREVTVPTQTR